MSSKKSSHIFAENIPPGRTRYLINVTIESGDSFVANNNSVYVRYSIDLTSNNWEFSDERSMFGVTHQSRACNFKHTFGHRFTLDLSGSEEDASSFTSVLLLLELYEVDYWNRQKSIGYGFAHIPLESGCRSVFCPTWRPQQRNRRDQLQQHFLSLAHQMENTNYVGVPNTDEFLGRFPLKTEISVNMLLRFDTVIQRGQTPDRPTASSGCNNKGSDKAVDKVIEAYQRAKQRLKAAHEALLR